MPIVDFSNKDAPFYEFVLDAPQGGTAFLNQIGAQLITVEVTIISIIFIPRISLAGGVTFRSSVVDQGRLVIPFTNPVTVPK
jgi:hypothetical protein